MSDTSRLSIPEEFVLEALRHQIVDMRGLQKLRHKFSARYGIPVLLNLDLIKAYRDLLTRGVISENPEFFAAIQKRKVRTLSGIAPISIFTRDFGCPGKCVFCPTEKNMPKSYLSSEPGMMRAVLNHFDPFKQVHNRLRSLEITGHNVDKIELIVQGGTFSALPKKYQVHFLKQAFNAMNTYEEAKSMFDLEEMSKFKYAKLKTTDTKKLAMDTHFEDAKKRNETAGVRCVGLTLETRPDWVNKKEIKRLRWLGATRLEIGVQTTHNDVLMKNKRGHLVGHSIRATQLMRDAGFKFTYHMMPGLPGTTFEKDVEMFMDIFTKPDFQPDQIKFYPCVVTDFSELTTLYKEGKFQPMGDEQFVRLACMVKPHIPPWVRLVRLIRDIPAPDIIGGSKTSNLRQVIDAEMQKKGLKCRCIRCREVRDQQVNWDAVELVVRPYDAGGGKEYFISFEDVENDILLSFLRLRIPSQYFTNEPHFIRVLNSAALVREIHTYGAQLKIGQAMEGKAQHFGFGRRMMEKAEEIAESYGLHKIAVIAGIGVREYFRGIGYDLEQEYMVKRW